MKVYVLFVLQISVSFANAQTCTDFTNPGNTDLTISGEILIGSQCIAYRQSRNGICTTAAKLGPRMYEGQESSGRTLEQEVERCAEACLKRQTSLDGSWTGRTLPNADLRGFAVVHPQAGGDADGRCYCEMAPTEGQDACTTANGDTVYEGQGGLHYRSYTFECPQNSYLDDGGGSSPVDAQCTPCPPGTTPESFTTAYPLEQCADFNECTLNPCPNLGICSDSTTDASIPLDTYECDCGGFTCSGTAPTPAGNTVAYSHWGDGSCSGYLPLMYHGDANGYNPGSTQGGGIGEPSTNDFMILECAKACLAQQTPQANTWDVDTGSGGSPRPDYQNGLRGFSIMLDDGTKPGRCFCELENMQHCDDRGGRSGGASGYESFAFECPGMYLDGDPWGDFSGECIICGYENKIYDSSGVDGIGTNPDLAEPHFDVCTYCPNDQDPLGPVLTEKLGVTRSGFGRNGTTCGAAYSESDTDFSCSGGYCDDHVLATCSGGSYVLSEVLAATFHRVGDDNDYCDSEVYLDAGVYPAGLAVSDPLYNVNKLEECKNRCLAEAAGSMEGFFVKSYDQPSDTTYDETNYGCGCCTSNSALRTDGALNQNKYETYRIDDPHVYDAACPCFGITSGTVSNGACLEYVETTKHGVCTDDNSIGPRMYNGNKPEGQDNPGGGVTLDEVFHCAKACAARQEPEGNQWLNEGSGSTPRSFPDKDLRGFAISTTVNGNTDYGRCYCEMHHIDNCVSRSGNSYDIYKFECPIGQYLDDGGTEGGPVAPYQARCTQCPAGKTTLTTDAVPIEECVTLPDLLVIGVGSSRPNCNTCDEVGECATGYTCGEPEPAGYGSGALDYTFAHDDECQSNDNSNEQLYISHSLITSIEDCADQCRYRVWEAPAGTFQKSRGFIYSLNSNNHAPAGPRCVCEAVHSMPHPECVTTQDDAFWEWKRYDFNGHWEADYVWAHHQQCNPTNNADKELIKTVTSIQDCADQCRGEVWSTPDHQTAKGFIYRSRANGGPGCYCESVHSHPHEECGSFASPDWHRYDFIPEYAFMHYGECRGDEISGSLNNGDNQDLIAGVHSVDSCAAACKDHVWNKNGIKNGIGFLYYRTTGACYCESMYSHPHVDCGRSTTDAAWVRYDYVNYSPVIELKHTWFGSCQLDQVCTEITGDFHQNIAGDGNVGTELAIDMNPMALVVDGEPRFIFGAQSVGLFLMASTDGYGNIMETGYLSATMTIADLTLAQWESRSLPQTLNPQVTTCTDNKYCVQDFQNPNGWNQATSGLTYDANVDTQCARVCQDALVGVYGAKGFEIEALQCTCKADAAVAGTTCQALEGCKSYDFEIAAGGVYETAGYCHPATAAYELFSAGQSGAEEDWLENCRAGCVFHTPTASQFTFDPTDGHCYCMQTSGGAHTEHPCESGTPVMNPTAPFVPYTIWDGGVTDVPTCNNAGVDARGLGVCVLECTASSDPSKDGSDGEFYCINGGWIFDVVESCVCICPDGFSGDHCETAQACTPSSNNLKDGTDGEFHCVNGGTIGGTTGSCTCTNCNAGWGGLNCYTPLSCTGSSDALKDGTDGEFYCVNGGTISGVTMYCLCTGCDAGYQGKSCEIEINECEAWWDKVGNGIAGPAYDNHGSNVIMNYDGSVVAFGTRWGQSAAAPGGYGEGFIGIYQLIGGTWTQMGSNVDGEDESDDFGSCIAISDDGLTVAAGAPFDGYGDPGCGYGCGRVRIFTYDGSSWNQKGQNLNGAEDEEGGSSVALSSDGSRVAVGLYSGVEVWEYGGGVWQLLESIPGAVRSIQISGLGNIVVIGSPYNSDAGTNAGHVRVFEDNGLVFTQKGLTLTGQAAEDRFGYDVCMNNDGSVIAVGAPAHDETLDGNEGTVQVFAWSGSAWVQRGQDLNGYKTIDSTDHGNAVSLSDDGLTLSVGAPYFDANPSLSQYDNGMVKMYKFDGTRWKDLGNEIIGALDYRSGVGVALSGDGNRVTVGTLYMNEVNVYEISGVSDPCLNGGVCTDLVNDYSCACINQFSGKDCDECAPGLGWEAAGLQATFAVTYGFSQIVACEGMPVNVVWTGSHNIQETESADCLSANIGPPIVDFHNSGYSQTFSIDELSAAPGQTRYFKCDTHCGPSAARFEVSCPAPSCVNCLFGEVNNQTSHLAECAPLGCAEGYGHTSDIATDAFTDLLSNWNGTDLSPNSGNCLRCPADTKSPANDGQCASCSVPGMGGLDCLTDTDECAPNGGFGNCLNGATCADSNSDSSIALDTYECTCAAGWEGFDCDIDTDECLANEGLGNCLNGATCADSNSDNSIAVGTYECTCAAGWEGFDCEIDIDECLANEGLGACLNGASCADSTDGTGTAVGTYECTCAAGWEGFDCEIDTDECAGNEGLGACLNGASCDDSNSDNSIAVDTYECTCAAGWEGLICETDIDECDSTNNTNFPELCDTAGTASCNTLGGVNTRNCSCKAGYERLRCEIDIDECISTNNTNFPELCDTAGTASCDTLGGVNTRNCSCKAGYEGLRCEIDIDECISTNNTNFPELCNTTGTVSCNTLGGVNTRNCICKAGYEGLLCDIDIDECISTNNTNFPELCNTTGTASCNTLGGVNTRNCSCKAGYEGLRCEIDIDECDPNPCERGVCTETTDGVTLMPDSWYCACPVNYIGKRCKTIETVLRLRAPEANVAIWTYAIFAVVSLGFLSFGVSQLTPADRLAKFQNGKPINNGGLCPNFWGAFGRRTGRYVLTKV